MKIQEFITQGYPYARAICFSCSVGGNELGKEYAEGPDHVFVGGQIELLEKIAKTHDRSKHRGIGNIRIEKYVNAGEETPQG